ncbi:MAG TPA: TIGR01459 family HAD-type hydrolase [Alphaproteobacteria bacterium]
MSSSPPLLSGLAEIADRYDGFLLDLWGCIHDGVAPFPHVADALRRVGAAGKRRLVLSNAPRRADAVIASMTRLGVPADVYDAVLSSGEATWQAIARRDDDWHAKLGTRSLHIGPDRDTGMLDGNGVVAAAGVDDATFILCTGPRQDHLSVEAHEPELVACRRRGLPMLCANPDLVVMRGPQLLVCAGAIAARYAELGGDVRNHGKPYPEIYERALRLLGVADKRRVLAVGDSLRTDVAGARAAGIDVAFIPGGIHAEVLGIKQMGGAPDPAALAHLMKDYGVRPTYVLPELQW